MSALFDSVYRLEKDSAWREASYVRLSASSSAKDIDLSRGRLSSKSTCAVGLLAPLEGRAGESGSSWYLKTSLRPCWSIEMRTGSASGYTIRPLEEMAARLVKSKGLSKSTSATSLPNSMHKHIGQSVGMSHQFLNRWAMMVKPPVLVANFATYPAPCETKSLARILQPLTTISGSFSASR